MVLFFFNLNYHICCCRRLYCNFSFSQLLSFWENISLSSCSRSRNGNQESRQSSRHIPVGSLFSWPCHIYPVHDSQFFVLWCILGGWEGSSTLAIRTSATPYFVSLASGKLPPPLLYLCIIPLHCTWILRCSIIFIISHFVGSLRAHLKVHHATTHFNCIWRGKYMTTFWESTWNTTMPHSG